MHFGKLKSIRPCHAEVDGLAVTVRRFEGPFKLSLG